MREEIQIEADAPADEDLPAAQSGLMKWMWPALGSLSIGAIVVMILQSPQMQAKLGLLEPAAQKTPAIVKMATADRNPERPNAKDRAPASDVAGESQSDRAGHGGADMAAITTRLKDQADRIKKLETIVGAVTGSVGAGRSAPPSSSMAKSAAKALPATSGADVDQTNKTDSLNIAAAGRTAAGAPPLPAKVIPSELTPVAAAPVDATGDTQAAARGSKAGRPPVKPAQIKPEKDGAEPAETVGKQMKVAALAKPGSAEEDLAAGGQYGIRLVIADQISKLKTAWKKLGKTGKDNELSNLSARVQTSKATNGKPIYALVAGPLPDMGEAIELCARLKLKGIPCAQSDFTGDPI